MQTDAMSRRLKIVGVVNLVFGVSLALAALPALNLPVMLFADFLIWPLSGPEDGTAPMARLMSRVLAPFGTRRQEPRAEKLLC